MKRLSALCVALACAGALWAQQVWEGTCAVSRYGVFPSSGLYGASNSFAQNTLVNVKDVDTGRQATVLIIDRTGDTGLFLLVSKDAGDALGIGQGDVARVQVSVAKAPTGGGGLGDLPYSPDPDVFPAAGVGNPTSLSFLDKYLGRGIATAQTTPPAQPTQPSAAETTPAGPTASPTPPTPTNAGPTTPTVTETPKAPAPERPSAVALATPEQPQPTTTPAVTATPKLQEPSAVALAPPAPEGGTAQLPAEQPSPIPPVSVGPLVAQLSPTENAAAPTPAQPTVTATPAVPESLSAEPSIVALSPPLVAPAARQLPPGLALALPEPPDRQPVVAGLAGAQAPPSPAAPGVTAVPALPAAQAPALADLPSAAPPAPVISPFLRGALSALPVIVPPPNGGPLVADLTPPAPAAPAVALAPTAELPLPAVSGPEAVGGLALATPPSGAAVTPGAAPSPALPGAAASPATAAGRPGGAAQPALGAAAAAAGAPQIANVKSEAALETDSYYLQLGVFLEPTSALSMADALSPTYPISVYSTTKNNRALYKVLIGPLTTDESGTLLYQFIAMGYRDAFLRKVN